MRDANMKEAVEWLEQEQAKKPTKEQEHFPQSFEEIKKVGMTIDYKARPHKFDCGTEGEVAQEVTIKLDFSKVALQAHSAFTHDMVYALAEVLLHDVNGLIEAAIDEEVNEMVNEEES